MEEIVKDKLFVIKNFFTDEDCQYLLDFINEDKKKYQNRYSIIESHKDIVEKYLYKLNTIKFSDQKISNFMSFAHYPEGSVGIPIHQDRKMSKSKFKVLIYLNDDFEGGNTIFYKDNNMWEILYNSKPEKGKSVIFDIDIFHKGEAIIKNEKYVAGFRILKDD